MMIADYCDDSVTINRRKIDGRTENHLKSGMRP